VAVAFGGGLGLAAERGPDALLEPDAIAEMRSQLHAADRNVAPAFSDLSRAG